ncbi:uncharacterized protein LOC132273134 [Cornus florida]|uniref:uncharacterized protein LOC132273134 n=1 Tax=Cornus florida TaxID=4283 RepID=UPI0028977C13|nr:uncharacterized protein LOC132273134 [Cornus florida]
MSFFIMSLLAPHSNCFPSSFLKPLCLHISVKSHLLLCLGTPFLVFSCKQNLKKKAVQMDGKEGDDEFSEITLRPLDLSDIDDVMVWATDDKVSLFCTWDTYTCREQAMDYVNNIAIPHPWLRAICLENRAIGSISVTPKSGNDRCRVELGYAIASNYWGRGIVTRAVKMVASIIFSEWPHLERLEALVDLDNLGSQKVLEKAGFHREGVLRKYITMKGRTRDMVIFSLLSTDPRLH